MHRQAGANCTDAKLYFWTIFQFFFYPNGTWHPLPFFVWDFWNVFNFAKPLTASDTENGSHHGVKFYDCDDISHKVHIQKSYPRVTNRSGKNLRR